MNGKLKGIITQSNIMSQGFSSQFPFEEFLSHPLPNYEQEWNIIIIKLILTTFFFLVIVPSILESIFKSKTSSTKNDPQDESDLKGTISTTNGKIKEKKRSKKYNEKEGTIKEVNEMLNEEQVASSKVPFLLLATINVIYIFIVFGLILSSPNNIDTSRRVFQAPLLEKVECQMIIDMAKRAAARNILSAEKELAQMPTFIDPSHVDRDHLERKQELEKLLKWPPGWRKDRHFSYPTTDLNVVNDFGKEDLDKIASLLHARLSPLLERIYGITKDSIRANDMFVVRYDGEGQQSLNPHTDSSHISFNILLNDEFEGGGTRFHDRLEGTSYYDAKPKPGDVLINNAMVEHEGLATTKGTRYIFVGFMNIDRVDPWTGIRRKVPISATFLSLPWLSVVMKSYLYDGVGINDDGRTRGSINLSHSQEVDFFSTAVVLVTHLGDIFAPHGLVRLIKTEKKREYLSALTTHYDQYGAKSSDRTSWFKGQQIYINLDGRVSSEWESRKKQPEKFVEL